MKYFENIDKMPQIFLLHFAGGSSYSFEFLKTCLDENIEFNSLDLPGRGKRFDENLLTDKQDAIDDYVHQIKSLRNGSPYIIYGHSMGANLGLEITKILEDGNDPPIRLVVSGNPGPGIKELHESGDQKGKRYKMTDNEFKEELRMLGGMPEEILTDENLFEFFCPIIRADFEVVEKSEDTVTTTILKTPIYALMGTEEKRHKQIQNWKIYTTGHFRYKILEGDHFFIRHHPQELIRIFESQLIKKQ